MDIKRFLKNLKAENKEIEYKSCKNTLPKEIWPTYSAFANTNGGYIILGVSEIKIRTRTKFAVTGVENPDKICNEFWTCISNPKKVNKNILTNEDVQTYIFDEKHVIVIHVPSASHQQKPIYINDLISNTFIRLNSADIKVNTHDLQILIRNQNTAQDATLLDNYSIERDLDIASIEKYKQELFDRTHNDKFLNIKNEDFLIQIGAMNLNRKTNKYCLTEGGLLFFGKINSILSRFPHFHLDYFDRRGNTPRWIDRIASDDISFQNLNLMNFFFIVMEKIRITIEEPFELENNLIRKSADKLLVTLREACINMIIHADYYINTSPIFINVYDTYYEFNNPGMMLISEKEFINGGKSYPRNTVITTLFRRLGLSERAGTGGPEIFYFARKNKFKLPELNTNFKETNIKIWKIEEVSAHPELSTNAKKIFEYMLNENKFVFTAREIKEALSIKKFIFDKSIKQLILLKLVNRQGAGKGTVYVRTRSSLEIYMDLKNMLDKFQSNIIKK